MKLKTSNMNGYNHTLSTRSFVERVALTFAENANDLPDIWALQEIPTGGKKYTCIKKLQGLAQKYGYRLILPENGWDYSEHPKSIQNALLVKGIKKLEVLSLNEKIMLHNRYNYVKAVFMQSPDQEYFILNIHAPQTDYFPGHREDDGYVRLRKHLSVLFYDVLKEEVAKQLSDGKRLVLMGDFNKSLKDKRVKELLDLGLEVVSDANEYTYVCPSDHKEQTIDHILVSHSIMETGTVGNCMVDQEFATVRKLSDHATVSLDIAM